MSKQKKGSAKPSVKKGKGKGKSTNKAIAEVRAEIAERVDSTRERKLAVKPTKTADDGNPTKRLSQLDAAAMLMREQPAALFDVGSLVKEMAERNLWSSPNGKTPTATLYAAMMREINIKGTDARFKKNGRGLFQIAGGAL